MRSTKTQTVNKDEWTRLGSEERGIVYTHVSGQWEIRKLSVEGCLAKKFCPIYIGPKRSVDPHLPWSDKLFEAQLRVVNYIKSQRENLTARHRAIQAQQDGDAALVLDCIFDHIDQKFEELQDELDRRFDRLRISFQ